ncbi:hypothetical protein Ancab_004568, partial [Ancistrocladus abbreviatus]
EEMQKEGISDCVVRSIGRMTVLLTATGTAKLDRMTQLLEVIHSQVCIKVEEDEFLVTVVEETMDDANRMGSFKIDNTGDHTSRVGLPPQAVVHNSQCKLEKEVMIVDTNGEDRDNDESVSVQVGIAELPHEVMGTIVGSGKLEKHNGGRRHRAQGQVAFSKGCTNPVLYGPSGI